MLRFTYFLGFALILCQTPQALASELLTPSFKITIDSHCEEGNVTCDKVTYLGVNRKTGASIKLKGKTLHTTCADGVSPCRFIGYLFKNGNVQYLIEEDGQLTVTRNKTEILVDEKGEWKN